MTALCLTAGGALGAICRYLLGKWFGRFQSTIPFPIPMLFVNIAGSFGLGLFFGGFYGGIPAEAYTDPWFLFGGVGFFGAFTTFSTFSMEAFHLLEKREYPTLLIYTGLSVGGAFLSFGTGLWIGG
ncbi:fluoride efflux transporter FluC [Salibacterium aidingense]|uniref:fluoride efflux transporter FluC n=1 Tax=Salibacterium aidingense TaxID=384933 RepID=UPI000405CC1F|nr:CrcB family protein [Salibacterium aidingense]